MAKQTSKTAYSFGNNLIYMLKNMWAHSRRYTFMAFFQAPFGVLEALLTIYLSQAVVSAVTQALEPLEVLAQTALIGAALLLCACVKKYMYAHMEPFMLDHDIRYNLMLFQHTISADYEAMESPEGLNQMAQALKNNGSDTSPTRIVVKTMSSFLENSIGIVAYGGILASLSPWILLTVSVTTIGSFLLMRRTPTGLTATRAAGWAPTGGWHMCGIDLPTFPRPRTCGCTACPAGFAACSTRL